MGVRGGIVLFSTEGPHGDISRSGHALDVRIIIH